MGELSVDVRAAVVLDATGDPLAGDAALAATAGDLLRSADDRRPVEGGTLLVARAPAGGAIAVLAGPLSVLAVLEQDLATAARALAIVRSEPPRSRDLPS